MSDFVNPSEEIKNNAYVKDYEKLYKDSLEHPDAFWENVAKELFWYKPWTKVIESKHPYYDWFVGGQTNIVANALKSLGVKKGDRVSIYMPRIPEQTIVMLASAKIGAINTVVYSGFSVQALKSRIEDAESKIVITADGYHF